jgi:ornithine cyclodeaminase/alanine dehydrogenase-like protein (mu-crystallin family)
MSVLILTRRDIAELMIPTDYFEAVEAAFRASKEGRATSPAPMHVDGIGGAFHAKGASLDNRYVALKLNGNFPGNPKRGLPTIQGAILLCDAENGSLLAITDSIEITIRRTAAASALAAAHLARKDATTLFISGCGEQGRAHVRALSEVRKIERVLAYDLDAERMRAFAADIHRSFGVPCEGAPLTRARGCEMVALCTSSPRAYFGREHVDPGAFVAAVGADSPSKNEVHPELMAAARVVADVVEQAAKMGDLRSAIAAGAMTADNVHSDLGDIVIGRRPARTSDDEIFIFDSTGTALQDVASAALAYERARKRNVGVETPLGAA